jgi:L,D-transpeptidase ErfK/SrfK
MNKNDIIWSIFWLCVLILQPFNVMAKVYDVAKNEDVVGGIGFHIVETDDTLYSIARQFDLGIVEIMAANPDVDPWIPEVGSKIVLPTMHTLPNTKRQGVVINLPDLRLYYFVDSETVMTFPIGIGKEGWGTPVGKTTITWKRKDPTWVVPPSIREKYPELPVSIPPGPDNPLGQYALSLGIPALAIHGTNKPNGIGLRSSHGCIRMYPEDIEILFNQVKQGTVVTIIDQSYKLGWKANNLFLEVVPTNEQSDLILNYKRTPPPYMATLYDDIIAHAKYEEAVDWHSVRSAIASYKGLPVIISSK